MIYGRMAQTELEQNCGNIQTRTQPKHCRASYGTENLGKELQVGFRLYGLEDAADYEVTLALRQLRPLFQRIFLLFFH
jgi:hypothetical protein